MRTYPKPQQTFWATIGMPARGKALYDALHKGLPYEVYQKLAAVSGLNKKVLAQVTIIPQATLQRRAKSGQFNPMESDRLYRFAAVYKAALDLFCQDHPSTQRWLTKPIKGLGNKRPIDMLATSAETDAVLSLIGQLEHGVFA